MPVLRRRHHVLAVGGDGQRCGRRRRRRLTGRGGEKDRRACRAAPRCRGRGHARGGRHRGLRVSLGPRRDLLGGANVAARARGPAASADPARGPALGRVDVDRTGGRPGATLAAPDHGAGGGTPGIAGPTRAPVGGPGRARPPDGSPRPRPGGQLPRARPRRRRSAGAHRCRGTGKPPVPRGAVAHADRRGRPAPRGRELGPRPRVSRGGDPADDPGTAGRPPRSARARSAQGAGASLPDG